MAHLLVVIVSVSVHPGADAACAALCRGRGCLWVSMLGIWLAQHSALSLLSLPCWSVPGDVAGMAQLIVVMSVGTRAGAHAGMWLAWHIFLLSLYLQGSS